jgi:hypothetical protein
VLLIAVVVTTCLVVYIFLTREWMSCYVETISEILDGSSTLRKLRTVTRPPLTHGFTMANLPLSILQQAHLTWDPRHIPSVIGA